MPELSHFAPRRSPSSSRRRVNSTSRTRRPIRTPGPMPPMTSEIDVLEDDGDPIRSQREIAGFIGALNEDEQIDLVALIWLGRGDGNDRGVGRSARPRGRGARRLPQPAARNGALSARRAAARRSSRRWPRPVRLLPGPTSRTTPVALAVYRAQSTITVPSLSPFSTARCACAVSDSANCAAML